MEVKLKDALRPVDVPDHLARRLARLNLVDDAEAIAGTFGIDVLGEEAAALEPASMSMRKTELVEMAEARGIAVETDDNKADLVAKINAALETPAEVQVTVEGEDGEIVYDETHDLTGVDADLETETEADDQAEGAEQDAE